MMKKYISYFFLLFLSINSTIAQVVERLDTTTVIIDSNNIDEEIETEDEEVGSNTDSIYKATLSKPDVTKLPLKPISTLDDTLSRIKKDKNYWYVNAVFKEKENKLNENPNGGNAWYNFFSSLLFKIIIWSLIIGIVLTILIMFLNENNISFFAKKSVKINSSVLNINPEENILESNFEEAITKATIKDDFTLATRLHYLHVIRLLHDKKQIIYTKEKTNFDYLMSLANTPLYKDFAAATRNYEFVWYGDFVLNKTQFTTIEHVFVNLKNQIQQL